MDRVIQMIMPHEFGSKRPIQSLSYEPFDPKTLQSNRDEKIRQKVVCNPIKPGSPDMRRQGLLGMTYPKTKMIISDNSRF